MKHEDIRRAFSEVYNNFYLKYRDKGVVKTDKEWDEIIEYADKIVRDFNKEDLVRHMISDLLKEFEISDKKYRNE